MSHMHRLLCAALLLFLLCCAYGCAASAVVQPLPQKGQGPLDAYTVAVVRTPRQQRYAGKPGNGRRPNAQRIKIREGQWNPIRIGVFPRAVSLWKKLCANDRLYGQLLGYYGTVNFDKDVFCDSKYGITEEKSKMIYAVTLRAAKLHSDRLRVQTVKGNLSLDKNGGKDFKARCSDALAHPDHLAKGVENADFALYVSLTRSYEDPRICTKDVNGRPTSALIKLNLKEIELTRQYIRAVAHEIGHTLGFLLEELRENGMVKEGSFKNGSTTVYLQSETLKKKAGTHYGCPDIAGVELSKGDFGTIYPHWKRRYAKDELMSPHLEQPAGMYYSVLTLSVFDSMSFYQADFSKAEPMTWGRNAGCEFLTGKCVENGIPKYPDMFCNETSNVLRCTTDRLSLGKCSLTTMLLPITSDEYRYFSSANSGSYMHGMDYCPTIEPSFETSCELGKEDKMPGSIMSNISRCLKVESPQFIKTNDNVKVEGICAKLKCDNGILKVQYKGNNNWHECTDGGAIKDLKGNVFAGGSIVCPKYTDFCKGVPKPRNPLPPATTAKSPIAPAAATPVGSTRTSTSTASNTSNVQTNTLPDAENHHEGQPVHARQEAEKQQVQPESQDRVTETHEGQQLHEGTDQHVSGEQPGQMESQSTATGDHEGQDPQEGHETSEGYEMHEELGSRELEEHAESDNQTAVETVLEDLKTEQEAKSEGQSILQELINATVSPKSSDVDSPGPQKVGKQDKEQTTQRHPAPNGHGAGNKPSGTHDSARVSANGHVAIGRVVNLTDDDVGKILNHARAMEDRGVDRSIATSYVAPLALLLCGLAALVTP